MTICQGVATEELFFEGRAMWVIERNGQAWLTAADIALSLGHSRSDKASSIYRVHAAEFRASTTEVIEPPRFGALGTE